MLHRAGTHVSSIIAALLALCSLAQVEPDRSSASFHEYAVAADHPTASRAGAEILAAGGNAADAAAATMLALGVVSPASSGLGGGGFALYWDASEEKLTFLDFRETAPSAATAEMFAPREGEAAEAAANRSRAGGLAVATPGEPAGIEELLRRFGSRRVSRAQIVAPAERAAREGWTVAPLMSRYSAYFAESMRADPLLASWLTGDSIPPGATLTNPELAQTLRTFARQGARPFYRGSIARSIVGKVQESGGVLSLLDLAAYRVIEREPLVGEAFGYRWATSPPPSAGGMTILHSLELLERWAPDDGYHEGVEFRHALAESWIGAYIDRAAYLGDPDATPMPIDRLLAPARLDRRAEVFSRLEAHPGADWQLPLDETDPMPAEAPRDHGTSHLCVVDSQGNIASITTTVNLPFGARITAAGMVLNDEMDDFASGVGEPNAFQLPGGEPNLPGPGRRPVSSMSPTIVFQDGSPVLCVGASGGSRIPTAAEQVALFILLFGMTPGDAVEHARIHHQGMPATLSAENRLSSSIALGLWSRGHSLTRTDSSAISQAIRIAREGETLRLDAASDSRKGGAPAGR